MKIRLTAGNVVRVHGETVGLDERGQLFPGKGGKAGERLHCGRNLVAHVERLGLLKGGFPRFDRVDDVLFQLVQLRFGQVAVQGVDLGRAHEGAFPLGENLDALGGGIGPLVKLPGEILHREDMRGVHVQLRKGVVHLRLGKDGFNSVVKQRAVHILRVVAVEQADLL